MTRIDKLLLKAINLNYLVQNGILLFFQNLLFKNKNIHNAQKILIFRTGSIGDSICALPAIAAVRKNFPDAEIDILTNAGDQNLVSLDTLIDKSIVNDIINYLGIGFIALYKKLKSKRYDLFIEFPQSPTNLFREIKFIFFFKALGIKMGFGWEIGTIKFFVKHQEKFRFTINERDRLLNILKKNGLRAKGYDYPLNLNSQFKSRVNEILRINNLSDKEKNIGFIVGAKRPQHRWPIEYFKDVADYLVERGYNIIIVGSKDDSILGEQLKGKNFYNFCGELTPNETALVLKNCRLTISNDTGPMHLSYAVGTPVIAIFSSRDFPGKWYPPDDVKNIVLRNFNVHCSMCFSETCGNNICMKEIDTNTVKKYLEILG